MRAYVYNTDMVIVAEIKGDDNKSIEAKFEDIFDNEIYGLSYGPAFGAEDGLVTDGDFEVIDVRG